ncbi:hypothetical protein ACHAPQ_006441 [Fusarium lateritium]
MQSYIYRQTFSNTEQVPKIRFRSTAKLHGMSPRATAAKVLLRDAIRLPNPKYRQIAGHVSRRTDNTAPVAPPPRGFRRTQTSLAARRLNRGRSRARKLGQKDGEDSDSDSDKNRNPVETESSSNSTKPPRKSEEPPGSYSEIITREESERLKQSSTLKLIGQHWTEIDQRRKLNAHGGHDKKKHLFKHNPDLKFASNLQRFQYSAKCDEIKTWDDQTRMFLDAALHEDAYEDAYEDTYEDVYRHGYGTAYKDVMGDRFMSHTPPPSSPRPFEVVIRDVEAEIIWRLNVFSPDVKNCRQHDTDEILIETLSVLYGFLWCCMPRSHPSRESVINSAAQLTQDMSKASTTKRIIEPLADTYMSKIIEGFADAFFSKLRHGVVSYEPEPFEIYECVPLQKLLNSRRSGYMTNEYIAWAAASSDGYEAEERYTTEKWYLNRRNAKSYNSMEDTRQEFIMNPLRPGVVSLILLVGANPMTVRDIYALKLRSLGWFHDDTGLFYWRYKMRFVQGGFGIFKVSMDNEVMEAWRPVNRGWAEQNRCFQGSLKD